MLETLNETGTTRELNSKPKKASAAKKLVQAAALAAALVPLASVAAEASTIGSVTCDYSNNSSGGNCGFGPDEAFFDFGIVAVDLAFDTVLTDFSVTITATTFPSNGAGLMPPGYVCVPISGLTECVDFEVTGSPNSPPQFGVDFTGGYNISIFWAADTESAGFLNGSVGPNQLGAIRLLHNIGGTSPPYDEDITTPGSYCSGTISSCSGFGDPGIGGFGKSFQSFTVAQVPEPTSLILLGTGISGLLYRRRRR